MLEIELQHRIKNRLDTFRHHEIVHGILISRLVSSHLVPSRLTSSNHTVCPPSVTSSTFHDHHTIHMVHLSHSPSFSAPKESLEPFLFLFYLTNKPIDVPVPISISMSAIRHGVLPILLHRWEPSTTETQV